MLFTPKEKGQGLVEYAFVLLIIIILAMAIILCLPLIDLYFKHYFHII